LSIVPHFRRGCKCFVQRPPTFAFHQGNERDQANGAAFEDFGRVVFPQPDFMHVEVELRLNEGDFFQAVVAGAGIAFL
jgi:hypothetical protein